MFDNDGARKSEPPLVLFRLAVLGAPAARQRKRKILDGCVLVAAEAMAEVRPFQIAQILS